MITDDVVSEKLYSYLLALDKERLIEVMIEALDEMQSWNGRTISHCIHTAIGSKEIEENKWQFPKKCN